MSLSADEKKEIVRGFVLQAPPHELKQVIKSTRVLVADDALVDSVLPEACEQYNCEQLVPVEVPEAGHRMVICAEGRDDEGGYLDPRSNQVFNVDHVRLTAAPTGRSGQRGAREAVRAKLEQKIDNYLKEHYKTGTASVFEQGEELVVVLNSEKSNPGSSWSGRWRSRTTVQLTGEASAKVSGTIRNHVHYYEEGNIQMENSHEFDKDVTAKSADVLPGRIAAALEAAEGDFHAKLDEMCRTLSDKSLKTLRRKLPVSKQLFDFSSGAHKLAAELTKAGAGR
eukprot:TRINITY_DN10885_c0_g1_i1.p1 TRINITY_DN10885_c0_g1~~TRINITY_DN10885_c0_g1_i1.p1  ORF type:complete len:312 (+),score=112.30 TRINITY_DN10885_c0_g1_i1:93-938(+)